MSVREALRHSTIEALDRELLLASVLKRERTFLMAHPEYELSEAQMKRFQELVKRRERDEPLAYILGEKEFFRLPFFVNRYTLIPRPETEIMVEEALKLLAQRKKSSVKKKIAVIDVGTGSGCIIVSVVKNFSQANSKCSFFAVDTSLRALQVAKKNAVRHAVHQNITFVQSNLLERLKKKLVAFDEIIVLANLPYLSETIYQQTEPAVHNFEPKTALLSGRDGLDHYRQLLNELRVLAQTKKVQFLLEISPEQALPFEKILKSSRAKRIHLLTDLAGKKRLSKGEW